MNLISLTTHLEEIISQKTLPGPEAQYLMSSVGRKSSVFTTFGTKAHKKSAVLVLLYEKEGEIIFPIMQRHTYNGVHSGQISLPGGKFEDADTDLSQTALRETEEEIGVAKTDITLLGGLTDLYIPPSNHHVHPYIGFAKHTPILQKDDFEVDELLEVKLSALLNDGAIGHTKVKVANGLKIKTPYFNLNNKVVWGATAMILSEFREMINRAKL